MSSSLVCSAVRCLTDSAIQQCRWECMDRFYKQLKDASKQALAQNEFSVQDQARDERLGELVMRTLYRVASQNSKRQREKFGILAELLNPVLLDEIAKTQRKISVEERRLCRLLRRVQAGHELIPTTKLKKKVWHEAAIGNPSIDSSLTAAVGALGKMLCGLLDRQARNEAPWSRFLASFPPELASVAIQLVAEWRSRTKVSNERTKDLERVLEPLSLLLQRRGVAASLRKNWEEFTRNNTSYELVSDTSYEVGANPSPANRTVLLLERAVYDDRLRLGPELMTSLVEFAKATSDDQRSCSILKHLSKDSDESYMEASIRLALFLGESACETADILRALNESNDQEGLETELKQLAADSRFRRIVVKQIIGGKSEAIKQLAVTIGILNEFEWPLPQKESISRSQDWQGRYPNEYRSVLHSLSESSPDAERIAETVLGKFYPSPSALQQQIDVLRAKLGQASAKDQGHELELAPKADKVRMQQRLFNLERRLTRRVSVAPSRRAKLIEKLQRRVDEETIKQFTLQCRKQVVAGIRDRFGIEHLPDDFLAPPLNCVLREIFRLSKPMRKLGIRLLFASGNRTTCGFDDEPKNLRFKHRMESMGINMRPWMDDQFQQANVLSDGTSYELAFTRDAVDFLLMGFHFDTCLSPHSFNFFSTVANAVDLNKRVVYGKSESGKVIGLCLFALNEVGEILTYHRYSHDP
ncbi:MAG: hypothetical protein AAGG44_18670, partial [Planctomycetota bacterium]